MPEGKENVMRSTDFSISLSILFYNSHLFSLNVKHLKFRSSEFSGFDGLRILRIICTARAMVIPENHQNNFQNVSPNGTTPEKQAPAPDGTPMRSTKRHNQSPLTKALTTLASDLGIAIITILTLLGIYLLDTVTPLGEPVWLLYFIPLALSYWSTRYYAIPAVCSAITLFLVAGLFLSPGGITFSHAFVLRFAFFLFFICVAITLWAIRRRQIIDDRL